MSLQISQHRHNKFLLLSIAKYFKSSSKVYYHDTNSIQLTIAGIKLWESVVFDHFSKYTLYGTKTIKLSKLLIIRELMLNKNYLMKMGRLRQWKPEIKLQIINIWGD